MADLQPGEQLPARWFKVGDAGKVEAPGLYEINDKGGAKATLHSQLRENDSSIFTDDPYLEILHGEVFGKYVTLLKSMKGPSRSKLGPSRLCKNIYFPWLSIEGMLLDERHLYVTEATVEMHDQSSWNRASSIQQDPISPDTFHLAAIPDVVASVPGGRVEVQDTSGYHLSVEELNARSTSRFHVTLREPCHIQDFMRDWITPLQVMIAISTGRLGGVRSISITNGEWEIEGEHHPSQQWAQVRVNAQVDSAETRSRVRLTDTLFTLQDMDWPRQCPLIFETLAKWEYVTEHWVTLLSKPGTWPVTRFVSAVQAVEALDRLLHPEEFNPLLDEEKRQEIDKALREAGFNSKMRQKVRGAIKKPVERSLDQRLRRLSDLVSPAMANVCSMADWPNQVARLRNIISHGLPEAKNLTVDHRPAQVATEILLHLLESTLLLNVGFEVDLVGALMRKRGNFEWRRRMISDYSYTLPEIR